MSTPKTGSVAPLLQVSGLTVEYPGRHGRPPLRAVDDVSLTIRTGETFGLVGESGSGKSSLCMAILGMVTPTSGTIQFDGHHTDVSTRRQRRELSRDLQVVFQDPYSSLNPARTIEQSLAEPLEVHEQLTRDDKWSRVKEMLDRVGLPAEAAHRYPAEFSGGQRQRISIARALMVSPKLVICDEPVSALDLSIQAQILNLLVELQQELSVAYLFVSHDLAVVRHMSSEVTVLYRGQVMETGPADRVCSAPSHPYTRALLAAGTIPGLESTPGPATIAATGVDEGAGPALVLPQRDVQTGGAAVGCPYYGRCPVSIERCRDDRPLLHPIGRSTAAACHLLPEPLTVNPSEQPIPSTDSPTTCRHGRQGETPT